MIKGVLIFNNQGLIRLSKFYEPIVLFTNHYFDLADSWATRGN